MEDDIPSVTPKAEKTPESLSTPQHTEGTDMPKKSRIAKVAENNSKRTLLLSLLGIIIILSLIGFFGLTFLETFANLVTPKDTVTEESEEETVIVLPPFIDATFTATNSAEITLTGTAEDGTSVKLYNNGKLAKETKIQDDHTFEFKNISLREGKNVFKGKAFTENEESKFSNEITISYLKEPPELTIEYPQEGQEISNKDGDRLQIEGKSIPGVTVTINGFKAIVDDEGKFKYVMSIKGGENVIKAVATDEAGNATEMERKFMYNP